MKARYLDTLVPNERRVLVIEAHRRQGGDCFICETPIDLDADGDGSVVLDYIDPLSADDEVAQDNVAVIHAGCGESRPVRDLGLARELVRLSTAGDKIRLGAAAVAPTADEPTAVEPEPASPANDLPRTYGVDLRPDPVEGPDEAPDGSGERTFGGAIALTVLGAVAPGSAYLATGRRRLGLLTLGIVVAVLLVPIGVLLAERDLPSVAADLASTPALLQAMGVAVLVVAAAWIVVIVTGHRMLLPNGTSSSQQAVGGALALVLALAVAVPSGIASRYAFATHDLIDTVFDNPLPGVGLSGTSFDQGDPWSGIPRINFLIIGGDATSDGGLTTNTMIVSSTDVTSGETVLIGLPRNLQNAPIPEENPLHAFYPAGYRCGGGLTSCLLSGLYTEASVTHAGLFGDDPDPGLTTLRGSVSEITGLDIHYYLLVDLAGFEQLVDALGGIDLDVGPNRVPIAELDAQGNPLPSDGATRYLPPGPQHLNGEEALAYARERGTDSSHNDRRMQRQRLVIGAILDRVDPVELLLGYLEVTSAASAAIRTDVPAALLPAMVDLAESVRDHEIQSVPITDEVTDLANPEFDAVRDLVRTALTPGS